MTHNAALSKILLPVPLIICIREDTKLVTVQFELLQALAKVAYKCTKNGEFYPLAYETKRTARDQLMSAAGKARLCLSLKSHKFVNSS